MEQTYPQQSTLNLGGYLVERNERKLPHEPIQMLWFAAIRTWRELRIPRISVEIECGKLSRSRR